MSSFANCGGSPVSSVRIAEQVAGAIRAEWTPPPKAHTRGYARLFLDHVQQADAGADFDILVGGSGTPVSKVSF